MSIAQSHRMIPILERLLRATNRDPYVPRSRDVLLDEPTDDVWIRNICWGSAILVSIVLISPDRSTSGVSSILREYGHAMRKR